MKTICDQNNVGAEDRCEDGRRRASVAVAVSTVAMSRSPAKPWKGQPTTPKNYVQEDGNLQPLDAAHFSAAGAILWYCHGDGIARLAPP